MSGLTPNDSADLAAQIPAIRRYARVLTRNADDAEDFVQSCLKRAIRRFSLFERGTNLRRWLFTIMHNEFVSTIRRTSRRGATVPLEDWHGELAVTGRQDEALQMRDLVRALGSLPGRDRQILYLIGIEGRTYENTAEILRLPTGTVKSRLFRAREKLRAGMEGAPRGILARAA